VSTASLVVGVAAAHATRADVLVAGVAGLVAGAMSMAAREYVSVSSQADTEKADLARERSELARDKDFEQAELASIYVARGLDAPLANEVAERLMAHDALATPAGNCSLPQDAMPPPERARIITPARGRSGPRSLTRPRSRPFWTTRPPHGSLYGAQSACPDAPCRRRGHCVGYLRPLSERPEGSPRAAMLWTRRRQMGGELDVPRSGGVHRIASGMGASASVETWSRRKLLVVMTLAR
jgi:hypothetical protein